MADWDQGNPEDDDIVSQFPANERGARTAVRTNFGVDHHQTNDADVGKHEVVQLLDQTTPTATAGQGHLYTKDVGSGVIELFYQDPDDNEIRLTDDGHVDLGSIETAGTAAQEEARGHVGAQRELSGRREVWSGTSDHVTLTAMTGGYQGDGLYLVRALSVTTGVAFYFTVYAVSGERCAGSSSALGFGSGAGNDILCRIYELNGTSDYGFEVCEMSADKSFTDFCDITNVYKMSD